jgi:hypothetical protein
MFEQTFKNIDDILWKEQGCTTELDYTEQTSWLLFLKYMDGLEQDKSLEAELEGNKYTFILEAPYRWESWASPKDKNGNLDHNTALTGDDLRDFVDQKLFPYLQGFKLKASGPNTIEYKIGEIFGEIKNKITSGYNLREIIDGIDELRFRSQTEKHELSHLYEAKIKNMGNAGRNGGEYYTPRPLIRAIVQVVKPRGLCKAHSSIFKACIWWNLGGTDIVKPVHLPKRSNYIGKYQKLRKRHTHSPRLKRATRMKVCQNLNPPYKNCTIALFNLFLAAICPLLALTSPLQAHEVLSDDNKTVTAIRLATNQKVHLDGRLDEPIWQMTKPATNFIQKELEYGRRSRGAIFFFFS